MVHQMDKYIFKSCVDLMPLIGTGAKRSYRSFEHDRIGTTDMEPISERDRLLNRRPSTKFHGELMKVWAADGPRRQPCLLNHI